MLKCTKGLSIWLCMMLAFSLSFSAMTALAEDEPQPQNNEIDYSLIHGGSYGCGTYEIWEQKDGDKLASDAKGCSIQGTCDYQSVRDTWLPGGSPHMMYVRLYVHLLAEDDGSNVISTTSETLAQIQNIQDNYLPYGIQFLVTIDTVNSSTWRVLSEGEINSLKNATAVEPDKYLNLWATEVSFSYSFATFPWDSDAQSNTGGIIMGHFHWGSYPDNAATHEIGHCFGLWHTFHGTEEVTACGACGEWPGCPLPDTRGDFCSDTPPAPLVEVCNDPGTNSTCGDQLPYGDVQIENFMGYTPSNCQNMFSEYQVGRMRCYLNDELDSWVVPFETSADVTLGPAPLDVQFTGDTYKLDPSWDWDFDDGNGSTDPSPQHTFSTPGCRTITVDVTDNGRNYQEVHDNWICAYADTMKAGFAHGSVGDHVKIDVSVHNYCDLNDITIPFTWVDGPLSVVYDSFSTDGLRTSYFDLQTQLNYDVFGKRATVYLGRGAQAYLPPGDGAVASLWFTINGTTDGCPIRLAGYAAWDPELETYAGEYTVPVFDGGINMGCCVPPTVGDLDQSGETAPYNVSGIDLSLMIDGLFINLDWSAICLTEADVDFSGQPDPTSSNIDGIDLSYMIDALFISLDPLSPCP